MAKKAKWMIDLLKTCDMGMGQNPGIVNPKIAGKWIFIPLKMVCIGIDPYPYSNTLKRKNGGLKKIVGDVPAFSNICSVASYSSKVLNC